MNFYNRIVFSWMGLVLAVGLSAAPTLAQEEKKSNDDNASIQQAGPSSPNARVSTKGVMRTQEALKEKGYYDGPIDGIIGPKTRAALRRYQQEQGLNSD